MKLLKILFFGLFISLISCSEEDEITESRIETTTPPLSEIDVWIRKNLTDPYNIQVDYLFNDNEVETNKYLTPPNSEVVIPFLEAYQEFMIEPFAEMAGEDFVRRYFSKLLVLVGGRNFNNDGTVYLGQAEGGVKVTLYELNLFLERTSPEDNTPEQARAQLSRYFKTLQHEFAHILQQSVPFDKETYGQITPQYRSSWYNLSTQEALNLGYITPYAAMNENEDFAEMVSVMLTTTPEAFEYRLSAPNNEQAEAALRQKMEIIDDYYQSTWGIDIYQLQEDISEKFEDYLQNQQ